MSESPILEEIWEFVASHPWLTLSGLLCAWGYAKAREIVDWASCASRGTQSVDHTKPKGVE
jgi:hypothetical protein